MPASPTEAYPELAAASERWPYRPSGGLLAGRTILVTGASQGIGRTAARTFSHYGANVVLLARNKADLDALYDQIRAETATEPAIVPGDLETLGYDDYVELGGMIRRQYGHLDGLLHNAGLLGPRTPIEHYDIASWQRVMQVNVTAQLVLTQALLPSLRAADDASIVFTSSSVGRRGRAYWGAYAVSKFAVEGLAQVLADELEDEGRIRVNTLNPGATRTAMRAAAYPGEDPETVAPPERHMALYLYLMGPDSRGITGQQLDARGWSP